MITSARMLLCTGASPLQHYWHFRLGNSFLYGWGEGSVGEGLAPQSHGPEFGFPKCQVLVSEQGGRDREILGLVRLVRGPVLKNKLERDWARHLPLPSALHMSMQCIYMHPNAHTHMDTSPYPPRKHTPLPGRSCPVCYRTSVNIAGLSPCRWQKQLTPSHGDQKYRWVYCLPEESITLKKFSTEITWATYLIQIFLVAHRKEIDEMNIKNTFYLIWLFKI